MMKYRRTVFKDNTRTITIHNTLRWNTGSMEYEKVHVLVEKKSQNLKKSGFFWLFLQKLVGFITDVTHFKQKQLIRELCVTRKEIHEV